jgi:hypothetical protein
MSESINNTVIADIKGSVLEYLADYRQRVVSIEIVPDGFEFMEQCDCYFKEILSLEQFDKFIKELQDLREKYVATR